MLAGRDPEELMRITAASTVHVCYVTQSALVWS